MKNPLDHFGILAPFYEKLIAPKFPEKLLTLAQLDETGNVLDIGGGTGRVASFLIGKVSVIIIADESIGMLREAQKKDTLLPVCGKSERMPFGKETLDRIIMVDALHHVQNQRETAHEMWRLIKPGGKIIIEEPDIRKGVVKVMALLEKLALMRSHFLDVHQIAALFDNKKAVISIHAEEHTVWVVIEKTQSDN